MMVCRALYFACLACLLCGWYSADAGSRARLATRMKRRAWLREANRTRDWRYQENCPSTVLFTGTYSPRVDAVCIHILPYLGTSISLSTSYI
ncbi:hypothetical protein F4861DRAFT_185030 [Xylaria intraflava]|nr:hypothetical protein F4861DRAFT_185030 [Xylaria intraflava]